MTFAEAMSIRPGITALIGGGGKTSLMMTLAEELKEQGRVIICTTTHIYTPEGIPLITGADGAKVQAAFNESQIICIGEIIGEKLRPSIMPVEEMAALTEYVIVEADGAKMLPLKAHASHEPVIPDGARVIYVIGADGIGKPIAQAAHRPELYAEKLGMDIYHIVTPEDGAKLVDYGDTVLFNKAECERDILNGRRFGRAFTGTTVIASLKNRRILEIIKQQ